MKTNMTVLFSSPIVVPKHDGLWLFSCSKGGKKTPHTTYAMTQSPLLGTTHQPVICVFHSCLRPCMPFTTKFKGAQQLLSLKKRDARCIFSAYCGSAIRNI